MTEESRYEPVTDEERARAEAAREQLRRDLAAARQQPTPPVTSPGKFTEPIGLDEDGNLQPPLSPRERAHNEEVRRRAAES